MEAFERLKLIRERLGFDAPEFAARLGYSNAGSYSKQELKPISNDVLKYWKEVIKGANPELYVFSRRLNPGEKSIRREQITRRWEVHCKKGLGIKADMYTLKHAHADQVAAKLGLKTASDQMSHTDTATSLIYAQQEKQRRLNELKKLKIKL